MRMMLKVRIPVEAGNARFKDGSLGKSIQETMDVLKPESAYFFAEDGQRTALYIFDMADTSQIPVIAEPLFQGLNADLSLVPVMNADDVRKGIEEASKRS